MTGYRPTTGTTPPTSTAMTPPRPTRAARGATTARNLDTAIADRYGAWSSLSQYVEEAQVQNYEDTRAQFEAFTDHADNTPVPSTGTIYWQLNKGWPSLLWTLYGSDGDRGQERLLAVHPAGHHRLDLQPRQPAGHHLSVRRPAGAADPARLGGLGHRCHLPAGRAGRRGPGNFRHDHQHLAVRRCLLPAGGRAAGTASGQELPGDNELQSSIWRGNDITLFPGESQTLTVTYDSADLQGATPVISVSGWNVPRIDIAAARPGTKGTMAKSLPARTSASTSVSSRLPGKSSWTVP